jgi:cellulose synthase/poly-beta-1,6-N-acetylglucosamine synthase-like glycosyltransferase
VIEEFGGYKPRTLAEDTDLTFDILMNSGWKINYEMNARVWSNEPTKLRNLWDQRVRWARGNIQVTWLHRKKVGKRKHGKPATIYYPFWLAHIVLPIAFLIGTSGIMLSILFNIGIPYPSLLKDVLLFSFFGIWFIVSVMYRFRSSFEGLTNPGFVMLAGFISFLFFDRGIFGVFESLGLSGIGNIIGIAVSLWLFIAIPGSYFSLWVSKRSEGLGQFLQLGVFGYWMFLVSAAFQGYVMELRKRERIWIKTRK